MLPPEGFPGWEQARMFPLCAASASLSFTCKRSHWCALCDIPLLVLVIKLGEKMVRNTFPHMATCHETGWLYQGECHALMATMRVLTLLLLRSLSPAFVILAHEHHNEMTLSTQWTIGYVGDCAERIVLFALSRRNQDCCYNGGIGSLDLLPFFPENLWTVAWGKNIHSATCSCNHCQWHPAPFVICDNLSLDSRMLICHFWIFIVLDQLKVEDI